MSAQEFEIIVYGATGFTGRLVAEHLLRTYGVDGDVRWAMLPLAIPFVSACVKVAVPPGKFDER